MRYIKEFYRFFKHIYSSRGLLITLTKNSFKKQYLGSYLGLAWAFLQPLLFMLVIWFVFSVGFRAGPSANDTPFVLWLMSGMIPWFFLANAITSGSGSIVNNSFLVKKVSFRISILPLVEIGSALIIHLVLVVFLITMFLLYGYIPNLYWLQLPYYMFCAVVLVLGISWLTSAIRVFVKDIGNLITVFVQIGFWATPIFWSLAMVPEKYQWIIKLNPAYYIVNGYRDSFVSHIWFWEHQNTTMYYLITVTFFLALGALVFKRLRPHFGDVL